MTATAHRNTTRVNIDDKWPPMPCHTAAATTTLKACNFNSSWNWVRQDALLMYYDIIFGQLTTVDGAFLIYLEKQSS